MDYKKIVVTIDGKRYRLLPLDPPEAMTPIDQAEFSVRTENALAALGITRLEQLASMTEFELLRQPNFGRKSLNEVKEELWKHCALRIGQFAPDD